MNLKRRLEKLEKSGRGQSLLIFCYDPEWEQSEYNAELASAMLRAGGDAQTGVLPIRDPERAGLYDFCSDTKALFEHISKNSTRAGFSVP